MLDVLFIIKRNSHGKYFAKLSKGVRLKTEVNYLGMPTLGALFGLIPAMKADLHDIIEKQVEKKSVQSPRLFSYRLFRNFHYVVTYFLQVLRFAKYHEIFKQKQPAAIAVWNGHKLPAETLVYLAKSLNIKVWYFENGLLPRTTTLDCKGVNDTSSIPKDPQFYLNRDGSLASSTISSHSLVQREPHKQRAMQTETSLPDNFIFIPFQVPNDSQIISNSSWIKSMEQFYEEVVSAFDTHLNDSLYLVFKEHPSWPKHYEHLYDKHPNILFANGNNTQELIQKAKAVVTINSTVGLEALLLGRKVITLGSACYNVPGLVIHCPNSDVLRKRIAVLDEWEINESIRSRFLAFLQTEYCIPEQWVDAGAANIHAVERRMNGQDGFLKEFEEVSVDNTHHKNWLIS
ncbi:MAG: capsular biosynthesis protein [Glaciecola sp.]|jgi:capsular polysaccharide export protein